MTTSQTRFLVLPPLLEAIEAWRADPSAGRADALRDALAGVADALGLAVGRLEVSAPPLPTLRLEIGSASAEHELRLPGEPEPIGRITITGDSAQASRLARALEMAPVQSAPRRSSRRWTRP